MITSTGDHLYLIDFGIARIFKPAQLQDTLAFGTPGYAPPEQYGGGTTERSDIFSFGATLHQLLTGFDPTKTLTPFCFPPIQQLNPHVPPQLEKLIAQMVETDPEKRPPSILVVKRELQHIKQELQRGNFARSLTTSGKVIVPTLPNTVVGATLHTYRKHTDSVQAIAWSHAVGSAKIVVGCEDATAHSWNAATGDTSLIYKGHSREITSVAWSPDDRQIVSGSRDKTVQIWDARVGNTLYTYRGHTKEVYAVAWSPDGKFIASAGEDKTVRIWDAATGNTIYIYHCHTSAVCAIAWSPDGTRIASAGDDKTVLVWQAC